MCEFCSCYDFGGVGYDFAAGRQHPTIYFPSHTGWVPKDERFKFCPVCGKPLTSENFKSLLGPDA